MQRVLEPAKNQHRVRFTQAAVVVLLLLLAAIFLAPQLNVSRFRHRVEQSVSSGLGRPVQVGAVSLRLFPSPAFVLSDVTVAEDPAFGVEPAMTAPTVTAVLQMSSLLRGHFAVATLSLDDPSLNLARSADGRWDFESILRKSNAPHARMRSQFPYVEATGARINFKYGAEKQPFSLMDAEIALWRESSGQWHVRLKAQPLRTDLDMNDTGELRAEVAIHLASTAALTPVTGHAEWVKAPLGEISRLFTGRDSGWRAMAQLSGDASGTLADLTLRTEIEADNLRRTEVVPADEWDVRVDCGAHLLLPQSQLQAINCSTPFGAGSVQLTGNVALGAHAQAATNVQTSATVLHLDLQQIPANTALQWLRHVRAGIPSQMSMAGDWNGSVACGTGVQGASSAWDCAGAVHLMHGALLLPGSAHPLYLPALDWVRAAAADTSKKNAHAHRAKTVPLAFTLAPARLALGAATPVAVSGALTQQGYSLSLNGPATLETLLPMAQAMGWMKIPVRVQGLQGHAMLALTRQGFWLPRTSTTAAQSAPPSPWSGTVQLQNVRAVLENWPGGVQLTTATAHLNAESILLDKLRGTYQQQSFDGSLSYAEPQPATSAEPPCRFHLHATVWTPGQMHLWKQSNPGSSPRWLTVVQRWMGDLPTLPNCMGTLQADRIVLGALVLNHAVLDVHVHDQQADFSAVQGNIWGGTVQGSGSLTRGTDLPEAQMQITARGMQVAAMATAFHAQHWGSGSIDLQLRGLAQGWTVQQLTASATGMLSAQWNAGGWNAAALATSPLARFQRLAIQATVQNQTVTLTHGDLLAAGKQEHIRGTLHFPGTLHLTLQPSDMQVKGTLGHPELIATPTLSTTAPTQ